MHDLRVAGAQTGAPAQKALQIKIFVTVSKTPAARLVFDPDTFVALLSANAGSTLSSPAARPSTAPGLGPLPLGRRAQLRLARRFKRLLVRHDRGAGVHRAFLALERISRAAEGQQTLEIESAQSCTNQAGRACRRASIERLRVNHGRSSSSWNKPVTPEVAGSSPVAPAPRIRCKPAC